MNVLVKQIKQSVNSHCYSSEEHRAGQGLEAPPVALQWGLCTWWTQPSMLESPQETSSFLHDSEQLGRMKGHMPECVGCVHRQSWKPMSVCAGVCQPAQKQGTLSPLGRLGIKNTSRAPLEQPLTSKFILIPLVPTTFSCFSQILS